MQVGILNVSKFYTGVGSRNVPLDIYEIMYTLAQKLAKAGYVLRSGGANGSDSAFEKGCDSVGGRKEIYLPWKGFNNNDSPSYKVTQEAMDLAAAIHPAWDKLKEGPRKLHARNCFQVMGQDLKTPSRFLICWTEGGQDIGGTRTAIVLARQRKIPVYNLGKEEDMERMQKYL